MPAILPIQSKDAGHTGRFPIDSWIDSRKKRNGRQKISGDQAASGASSSLRRISFTGRISMERRSGPGTRFQSLRADRMDTNFTGVADPRASSTVPPSHWSKVHANDSRGGLALQDAQQGCFYNGGKITHYSYSLDRSKPIPSNNFSRRTL